MAQFSRSLAVSRSPLEEVNAQVRSAIPVGQKKLVIFMGNDKSGTVVPGANQMLATVEEAEKGLILRTLEHTRNNKTRAAEILGISLKTLHNKLKEYGAKEFGISA